MNIYVGDDLRKRMDRVKEPPNWSAIACQAFEAHLGQIAARKRDQNMDDVVQRLRASKITHEATSQTSAEKAGREWAQRRASFDELQRLSTEAECLANNGGFIGQCDFLAAMRTLAGDSDLTGSEARKLWKEIDPESEVDLTNEDALGAFLQAAVDLFDEVQDKLD